MSSSKYRVSRTVPTNAQVSVELPSASTPPMFTNLFSHVPSSSRSMPVTRSLSMLAQRDSSVSQFRPGQVSKISVRTLLQVSKVRFAAVSLGRYSRHRVVSVPGR